MDFPFHRAEHKDCQNTRVFFKFTLLQVSYISPLLLLPGTTNKIAPAGLCNSKHHFIYLVQTTGTILSFLFYIGVLNIQNPLNEWYIKMQDGRWELANSSAFLIFYRIQCPVGQRSKLRSVSHRPTKIKALLSLYSRNSHVISCSLNPEYSVNYLNWRKARSCVTT